MSVRDKQDIVQIAGIVAIFILIVTMLLFIALLLKIEELGR